MSKQNQEIYIGSTNSLKRRVVEHNKGKEISTKRYKPWQLIYYEAYITEKLARMREKRLKYNGNAIREVKKRIGINLLKVASPSTTFADVPALPPKEKSDNLTQKGHNRLSRKSGAGFTMIELMVTVSIFVVVSTITLANYPKFSSNITLDNLAHAMAISIREAQVFGLSVKEFGSGSSVFPGYGTSFDQSYDKSFILFADSNGDKEYSRVGGDACVGDCLEKFSIADNNKIYTLCGDLKADGVIINAIGDLNTPNSNCGLSNMDISFTRPDPDATLTGTSVVWGKRNYSDAEVVVVSPKGSFKIITVWTTGQISVE